MDENEVNQEADAKSAFMIKSFPVALRERVTAAAGKRGETNGEWVARAARNQLQLEAGEPLVPPGLFGPPAPARPITSTADVIALLRLSLELGEAGVQPPRKRSAPGLPTRLRSQALALVSERIREARGLLPLKPRERGILRVNSPEKRVNQLRVVGDE